MNFKLLMYCAIVSVVFSCITSVLFLANKDVMQLNTTDTIANSNHSITNSQESVFGNTQYSSCCQYLVDTSGCTLTVLTTLNNEIISSCRYESILSVDIQFVNLGQNSCCGEGIQPSKTPRCYPSVRLPMTDVQVLPNTNLSTLQWFQSLQDSCYNVN
jgi:hypothetical protein